MQRRVKYSEKAFEAGIRPSNIKFRRLQGTVLGLALGMPDAFRVKWDGRKTIDRLHRDFLEKAMPVKLKKSRLIRLRFRKNDPTHNLQAAAQAWLLANGGTAIVIGGIGVMNEGGGRYQVCVAALGHAPRKKVDGAEQPV